MRKKLPTITPFNIEDFSFVMKMAKDGGYSFDDSLFWWGVFCLIKDQVSEEWLNRRKKRTNIKLGKKHKDWK